ncbi:MAG: hypothetical protein NC177_14880 [Ruminococcus flavefaciens]|nr:hypothetical protein [Ruminococcus flavefaciens]
MTDKEVYEQMLIEIESDYAKCKSSYDALKSKERAARKVDTGFLKYPYKLQLYEDILLELKTRKYQVLEILKNIDT